MSAVAAGHLLQAVFLVASLAWLVVVVRGRRPARLRGRTVLVVALLLRAPFFFADQYSNDLHRYVWEGRIQWEGYSPYAHAPADPALAHLRGARHDEITHAGFATIYPPLAQLTFALAWKAGLREIGVRNLMLGVDLLVVLVLVGWLRATGRSSGRALVYAWCPLAVCSAAAGHVDPLMLLALAGAAWAWETGRVRTAAALLGAAILAKTPAVVCVPWLLLRRPRATLLCLVPVVALGYLPYWLWDGGGVAGTFATLVAFGRDFAFNGSLFRLADWAVPSAVATRVVAATLLAAYVAIVAVAQPRLPAAAALLFAGLLCLSPTVHFWYLTWFLVFLPAAGPRRWTWPLLVWCVTIVLASETYRSHFAGEPFRERFLLTWIEYAIPVALGGWLLARYWPRLPRLAPAAETPGASPAVSGRFAVVIPCRGEAANLETLVPAWLATPAKRVVLADTPTGDGTEALARTDARVDYRPVRRRGYGAAVLAGIAAAERAGVDFAVVCDADHGRGPAQAAALLAPFADPGVGLVTAARIDTPLSPAQRLGNRLASLLIGLGWGVRFHDLGPFRAVRLAAWREWGVSDPGFGINVQMNVRALERGWSVREVGLSGSERAHGENRISGTWAGVSGAGYGILRRIYRLRAGAASPMEDATVVVLTKLPGHLPVKTRLVPVLGEKGARDFHVEMLRATLRLAPEAILAYSPRDADPRRALPELADLTDDRFHPVAGDDGAACLESAFADLYRGRPLVALGGDAPDLPRGRLDSAVAALRDYHAAFVPTPDGGFSCLAVRAPIAGLARGFTYGEGDALARLRAFLESRGLEVVCLAPWPDVDTPADLAAYRARERARGGGDPSPVGWGLPADGR